MAAGRFVVPPYFPARDRDFNLLAGALLYVYENETTTKASIYTDEALSVLSSNPVVANSSGQFPAIWAEAGSDESPALYRVAVTTSTGGSPGNPFVFDNYRPSVDWETAAAALAEAAAILATAEAAAAAASADEAEADAIIAAAVLAAIEAIIAGAPEAPSILNKLNRNGDNAQPGLLAAIGEQYPDLTDVPSIVDSDVLALYRTPGPLRRTTAGTLLAYIQAGFGTSAGSSYVGFLQAGTGAVLTTAQAKLRQAPVQPNSGEFGAFTDATITTATLLRAFTAAMLDGRAVELSGAYTINGPITPPSTTDGLELHIIVRDDVTITVDAASTAFNRVFYAESTTAKSHSITGGGTLTINCNDKAAAGIWLRHNEAATGGTIFINAPVHVKNVYAVTAYSVASGIFIVGRFERVVMRSPTVEDVSRQLAGGESSGISISDFDGEVELYSPVVRRIEIGGGTADADGIKCFGRGSGFTRREGSVRIYDAIFEDCQGRSYKDLCGDTVLYRPEVRRRAIDGNAATIAIADSVEFDFQRGGGLVLNPHIEYYKSATSVSPLGASHSVAAFQQIVTDAEMCAAIRNGTIVSDVDIVRYVLSAQTNGAASTTEVDGLTLLPRSGFSTTMIGRGVLEFDASQVAGKSAETTLSVKNVSGPITFPCIAYTGYTAGTDLTAKLTVKVDKCSTSLAIAGNQTRAISPIAGDQILSFKAFEIGDNPGFRAYYSGWVFSVRSLRAGTKLVLDLTSGTVTNAPPWGATGVGYIECMGLSLIGSLTQDTICRAYLNNASTAGSAWFTQTGGATWGALN